MGAVVSWDGPGYNAEDGHTAVVVYDDPNGKYYVVGEANYWEEVQYRGTGTSRTEIVGIDMKRSLSRLGIARLGNTKLHRNLANDWKFATVHHQWGKYFKLIEDN